MHLKSVVVPNPTNEYVVRNSETAKELRGIPEEFPTVASILPTCAKKFSDLPLVGTRKLIEKEIGEDPKSGRSIEKFTLGAYEWMTYAQVLDKVTSFGSGLRRSGLKSDQNVSIYMNTCASWQVAAHAAFAMSSPVVTIYATLGEEAMLHSINETGTTHIVTEASLLEQLKRVSEGTPALTTIIYTGDAREEVLASFAESIKLIKFDDILADGAANPSQPDKMPTSEDLAVIMYTSGSTGMPKGVLLSHTNLMCGLRGLGDSLPTMIPGEDVYLSFLPLAHILALIAELFFMSHGCKIGYGSPTTLSDTSPRIKSGTQGDILALHPTYMACVPTVIDRIRQGVLAKISATSTAVQKLFWTGFWAKGYAFEQNSTSAINCTVNNAIISFWDMLVFNKIQKALGGRLKGLFSGGAPLSTESQRFMSVAFGIPVVQGYGLTETCAMATVGDFSRLGVYGRVGVPETTVQFKLIDWPEGGYLVADKDDPTIGGARGEICISGPTVSQGYYKMPEKTAQDFRTDSEGVRWFHSGDIGMMHPDGTLQIIDRKKDLVKLQQGEYVSLGKVEAALNSAHCVEQICVHANPFHSYCVALVVPQKPALIASAKAANINTDRPYEELCKDPAVNKMVLGFIESTAKHAGLARFETPARITIMHELWTPEGGLVTASLKLQRAKIYKHFADIISASYD